MKNQPTVSTQKAPAAVGPYCQARWAGDFLYLSGQLGLEPATGRLAGETTAEQARQVMQNLKAVLTAAGLSFSHLIKVNIYLIDMGDFGTVNDIYGSFFEGNAPLPARACVQVAALPLGGKVEIEGVAHR
jgi:2-iminobutanoate/2-iminopropanoate deaminase